MTIAVCVGNNIISSCLLRETQIGWVGRKETLFGGVDKSEGYFVYGVDYIVQQCL
jgi:hypothetical protein